MAKVLVVEENAPLLRSIARRLGTEGFVVDSAASGEDALRRLSTADYDVVVLDLGLSDVDAGALLRRLQRDDDAPAVLALSGRVALAERVEGLRGGADDYLGKPFHFDELAARVQALARRRFGQHSPRFALGRLEVDISAHRVTVDGEVVPLTLGEYTVLECLLLRRGEVCGKQWLLDRLVPSDSETASNVVEVHVSAVRRKLRQRGVEDVIVTRRGHGYLIRA